MVVGHVLFGGVRGNDINCVEALSALSSICGGTCACLDSNAREAWRKLLEGAIKDRECWPSKSMYMEL